MCAERCKHGSEGGVRKSACTGNSPGYLPYTVALERLAWELASNDPPILPIFVALRDYDGAALLDWIRLSIVSVGEIKLKSVEDTIQFLGDIPFQVFFLLDGLNEAPPTHREKLLGEIKRLSMEFPRAHLVVTSRVQDESWGTLRQSDAVHETYLVQPINPAQAQGYLAAHLNAADCDALWNRLDDKMKGLAGTPLLLWLIKEAWLESHNVPGNRGALYENFVERMLRRDDERKIGTGAAKNVRLAALTLLAREMHEAQVITLPLDRVEAIIRDGAALAALRVNGLLTGDRIIRFAPHQTVQEHFAARAIQAEVNQKIYAGNIGRLLIGRGVFNYAREPWWAETFIQLAGLTADPNGLARAVAEVNPWLAWWCVQDGKSVDRDTQKVIESRSIALVRSERVSDRRAAAQALAKLNSERVIPPLAVLSMDADAGVSQTALSALLGFGEAGQEAFVSQVTPLVRSERVRDRRGAAQALARLGSEHTIPLLLKLAGDDDEEVGEIALDALAPFGESVAPKLVSALDNPAVSPQRRVRIAQMFGDKGDPRPGVLDFRWGEDYWCLVPKGEFVYQGKPAKIDYDFWIARYPITNAQFQLFIDAPDGYHNPDWWKGLHEEGKAQQQNRAGQRRFIFNNHPAELVSWYEVMAFCCWLDDQWKAGVIKLPITVPSGYVLRLPLETEWEKAASWDAKAKKAREYPWGDGYQVGYANIDETVNKVGPHYLQTTTAVGIYPQGVSPCGALDMSGNVWEWCLNEYESGKVNIGSDATRSLRGGSWNDSPDDARAAARLDPYDRFMLFGFRVVVAPVSLGVFSDH